jgi:hypothetical protein
MGRDHGERGAADAGPPGVHAIIGSRVIEDDPCLNGTRGPHAAPTQG